MDDHERDPMADANTSDTGIARMRKRLANLDEEQRIFAIELRIALDRLRGEKDDRSDR